MSYSGGSRNLSLIDNMVLEIITTNSSFGYAGYGTDYRMLTDELPLELKHIKASIKRLKKSGKIETVFLRREDINIMCGRGFVLKEEK